MENNKVTTGQIVLISGIIVLFFVALVMSGTVWLPKPIKLDDSVAGLTAEESKINQEMRLAAIEESRRILEMPRDSNGRIITETSQPQNKPYPTAQDKPEVWVASVYESSNSDDSVTITPGLTTPNDVILILTSYEPVAWKILAPDMMNLKRVYVLSNNEGSSASFIGNTKEQVPIIVQSGVYVSGIYDLNNSCTPNAYCDYKDSLKKLDSLTRELVNDIAMTHAGSYYGTSLMVPSTIITESMRNEIYKKQSGL